MIGASLKPKPPTGTNLFGAPCTTLYSPQELPVQRLFPLQQKTHENVSVNEDYDEGNDKGDDKGTLGVDNGYNEGDNEGNDENNNEGGNEDKDDKHHQGGDEEPGVGGRAHASHKP